MNAPVNLEIIIKVFPMLHSLETIPLFLTVRQLAEFFPHITFPAWRFIVFNSRHNGFDEAIIQPSEGRKNGRKIYLKKDRVIRWIENGQA